HIAERGGLLRPLEDDGLGEPVVDLSAETTTDGERGLLGVDFDDDRVYLSYTDRDGGTVVERRDWDDRAVVEGTTETLLTLAQPYANHNGGDVALGPDGALWFGLGDGGGAGDPLEAGQDVTTPLGALLRLDPDTGEAAEGNPDLGPDADPRIWAYGLRNPWRFAFDEATGDLWVADVGQDDREEVNWLPAEGGEPGAAGAGANLGWSAMEGTVEFDGPEPDDHWPPIHEYETRAEGCAITGGVVYRGTGIDGLDGAYLYSDVCDGGVRGLRQDGGEVTEQRDLGVEGVSSVVAFAVDGDDEVYLLTFGEGVLRLGEAR
ncbi:MAG: PQQ-dependent sugar dehydrogenase, partial [Egibacteraceae bacterium]